MKTFVKSCLWFFFCSIFSASVHAFDIPFSGDVRLLSPGSVNVGDAVELEISAPQIGLWNESHGPFYNSDPLPVDESGVQQWIGNYGYYHEYIENIRFSASFAGTVVSFLDHGINGFGYADFDVIPPVRLSLIAATAGRLEIVPSISYGILSVEGGGDVVSERYCYGGDFCGDWVAVRTINIWSSEYRFEYSATGPNLVIDVQAVPEPAIALLLLLGVTVLPFVKRQDRQPKNYGRACV